MNFTILRFDTIDSTNNEAANQARLGSGEGLCVVARHQTAGRGRQGRVWASEKDAGLYFSMVLRPRLAARFLPLVTLTAGIAVYDTLEAYGIKPDIKWVNDIMVRERKISGILAETVETPDGMAVIVGIGINITSGNFPEGLADSATSLDVETAMMGPRAITAEEVEAKLTNFLGHWYEILSAPDGPAVIIHNWQTRSSYFSGKHVRVNVPEGTIEGLTDGLEENGALRVRPADGTIKIVQAGDVQQLRAD